METRTLDGSPGILPLYVKAAAPMIPGASHLPFLPGGGGEIPELELVLEGVRADTEQVAAYDRVCGFTLRDTLPPTYPHMLAFPLHMAVMSDPSFPFGAVGLVHVENTIEQRRPIALSEELTLRVRPTPLEPHPKGRTFSLLTEAHAGDELVWQSTSTMLRRGKGGDADQKSYGDRTPDPNQKPGPGGVEFDAPRGVLWKLDGDLGRRYGAVSGDRNPIHMHSLTAKPLGFPRAIAHGMWTKARCLAALESRLPDAFEAGVRFRKPIFLPGRVEFVSAEDGAAIEFAVRDSKKKTPHLDGRVTPLEGK